MAVTKASAIVSLGHRVRTEREEDAGEFVNFGCRTKLVPWDCEHGWPLPGVVSPGLVLTCSSWSGCSLCSAAAALCASRAAELAACMGLVMGQVGPS